MDLEEVAAVCTLSVKMKCKKRRKYWVHPLVSNRLLVGTFHTSFAELKEHPDKFFDYFRMSQDSFDDLVTVIGPRITRQDTNMRKCVPVEERLAVTLRYLATGNSFASLHFEFRLGVSTLAKIVYETCDALWESLRVIYMPEKIESDWLQIAKDFYENTQFPNCIGALDGKHVRITNPNHYGSSFSNCKQFFSIILMALVDSTCSFIAVDIGAPGISIDSNVLKNSNLGKNFLSDQLKLPSPCRLPNDTSRICMPHVIVSDEAFALTENVVRPYSNKNLTDQQRVFNYRLSRARRTVECTFGILANKWRIFHRALDVKPEFCDAIIKACCILHNFVLRHEGINFEDTLYECTMPGIGCVGTRCNKRGRAIRDHFASYFTSPQGTVSWQYSKMQMSTGISESHESEVCYEKGIYTM